jgi:hypothetical protein
MTRVGSLGGKEALHSGIRAVMDCAWLRSVTVRALCEPMNECEAGNSPPDIGGVDATSRKSCEASFNGADGVVRHDETFRHANHPVCAAAVASHLFLDGAATPMSGGEWRGQFIYTFHERPLLFRPPNIAEGD